MEQPPIQPVVFPLNDPQSDPEPAAPSLPHPDPGIFRPKPAPPASNPENV